MEDRGGGDDVRRAFEKGYARRQNYVFPPPPHDFFSSVLRSLSSHHRGRSCRRTIYPYTLRKKSATWNPFCPVFRTLGEKGSQKGSLHVQEPKKVLYITKKGSKEPKKVLKMVLKTHLEPFREPLRVPPVGQPKNPFF